MSVSPETTTPHTPSAARQCTVQKTGCGTRARQILGDVSGRFTEGLDTADLVDATALLAEL